LNFQISFCWPPSNNCRWSLELTALGRIIPR
jgi:hypothetical protein